MQRLEVSCAVRLTYTSLGAKGLRGHVDRFLPHLIRAAALPFLAFSYTVQPAYNGIRRVSRHSGHEGGTGRLYPRKCHWYSFLLEA